MVVIDWEELKNTNLKNLRDEEIDKYYTQLVDVKIEDEIDSKKLQKLFKLSQVVMQAKSVHAEVVLEELEKESANFAKKEQQLLNENDDLIQQIRQLQRYNDKDKRNKSQENSSSSRHESLTNQRVNERLQYELQETKDRLAKEKAESEMLLARLEESERERRDNRREIANLKDEINDYRNHMESQRDTLLQDKDKTDFSSDKIREKNEQINKLLEEIELLERSNDILQRHVTELKSKFENASKEMNISTSESIRLKDALQRSEILIDNLNHDNKRLTQRLEQTLENGKQKELSEEKVIEQLNQRLEDLKVKIKDKDLDMKQYRDKIEQLEEKIAAFYAVPDESKVSVLSKALEDRDEKIRILQEQVVKATKDLNENARVIENLSLMETSDGIESKYRTALNKLENAVKEKQKAMEDAMIKLAEADSYAQEKDRQLTIALTRMHEYESGEYGLSEAISEIKDAKLQLKTRDKQINELTQSINNKDLIVNQLLNENEELRERLGLDPREALDENEVKEKVMVRQQKEKWLNITLKNEIEHLEDERIQLRMQNRQLAQMAGQRAAYLGMSVEDLEQLHQYSEKLKSKREIQEVENENGNGDKSNLEEELKDVQNKLQTSLEDRIKLRQALKEAMNDIKHLEDSLTDVLNAIKEHNAKSDKYLQCPNLEKLIGFIESKRLTGSYDLAAFSKSQLDIERGKNEELRAELRRIRAETVGNEMKLIEIDDKKEPQIVQPKIVTPKWRVLELPENLSLSTSETIAVLNVQLIQVMNDLKNKTSTNLELHNLLNECKQKIAIFNQQQSLLYDEFVAMEKNWKNEKLVLVEEKRKIEVINLELRIKVEEFEKIGEIYKQDESEVRRRVAEMSGQFINSKSNEAVLNKKLLLMVELETELRKEIKHLQDEMIQMDSAITYKIQYLQKSKDRAHFQISWLQKTLQESAPAIDLEITTKKLELMTNQYENICKKYAEMNNIGKQYEEIQRLKEMLNLEEKEKLELQTLLQKETGEISRNNLLSVTEMQLANEKEKNEHLKQLNHQNDETIQQLNARNNALETKLDEITNSGFNHDLDKLYSYETAQQRITKLEEIENKMKLELSEQKEISKIARNQAETLNTILKCQNDEIKFYQEQSLEIASNDDDKFKIGQLQRQVAALKKSEIMSKHFIDKFKTQLSELGGTNLRLEQKCDEKEQLLVTCRKENGNRIRLLLSVLNKLRRQNFIGSQSTQIIEDTVEQLRKAKKTVALELEQARNERQKTEGKSIEYKYRLKYLEELINTLKNKDEVSKLIEWNEKVTEIRIREMKLQRENTRQNQEIDNLQSLIVDFEKKVSELDQEIARQTNEMDKQHIEWENCLMSRIIEEEQETKSLVRPVEHEPIVSGQFQNQTKALSRYQNENHNLHKKVSALLIKIKELESVIASKDKSVLQLQSKPTYQQLTNENPTNDDDAEQNRQIHVLKSYIETLQLQLSQKEEMLRHYQQLLHAAQDEINANGKRHQTILQLLHSKLHKNNDATLEKFKNIVQQASEAATAEPVLIKTQIQKLEDIVAEQDIALRNLADQLNQCRSEKDEWQQRLSELEKAKSIELEKILEDHKMHISELEMLLENKVTELQNIHSHVAQLKQELQIQKEATELAPSVLQQKCIEKLREQVSIKEKQLEGLSKAMLEVKSEIVAIAQEKSEPNLKLKTMGQKIRGLEDENKRLQKDKQTLQEELVKLKELGRRDGGDNVMSTPEVDDKRQEEIKHEEKVNEQMMQWMEKKKWQKIVDQLKIKLKEQEKDKEQLEKRNKLLTTVSDKLKLEKKSLENKLKMSCKETPKQENINELGKQLMELKEEKKQLESDLEFSQTEAIYLQDRIAELEVTVKELQTKDTHTKERISPPGSGDFVNQKDGNTIQMEQRILKLQEELTITQKIISDLKYEKANIKEKLTSCQEKEMMDSNRMDALENAADKLMAENGKLSRDLKKEQQINDSLRDNESKLINDIHKLNEELRDMKQHLKSVETKQQRFSTFDSKHDTVVRNVKLKQRIDNLENEVINKNDKIKELNEKLRESTDHERKLMRDVARLQKTGHDKANVKKI